VADSDASRLRAVIAGFRARILSDTGRFGHVERPAETLGLPHEL